MKITDLDQYADLLNKASTWKQSRQVLGYIKGSGVDDYIYEFYCYLRILTDLTNNYTIKYCPGIGTVANKFPRKPANKTGRPYFELYDKQGKLIYQVCAGTKVLVKAGQKRKAPDISFQKANADPDLPKANEIELIMDAKFHKSSNTKTQEAQFNGFWVMIDVIGTQNARNIYLDWKMFKGLRGNFLLTNGQAHTRDQGYLGIQAITQIEDFDEGKPFNPVTF